MIDWPCIIAIRASPSVLDVLRRWNVARRNSHEHIGHQNHVEKKQSATIKEGEKSIHDVQEAIREDVIRETHADLKGEIGELRRLKARSLIQWRVTIVV